MNQKINLEEFGIFEGISETIVTSGSTKANAAPVGIILKGKKLLVRVYRGSDTYSNIEKDKFFIANITYDSLLFVRSTFGDLNNDEFVMESGCPALKEAIGWVFFRCTEIEYGQEALVAWLEPVAGKINSSPLKAHNRGFSAVIEAAVHATRYELTGEEKYRELVLSNIKLAEKCGGQGERDAVKLLWNIVGDD